MSDPKELPLNEQINKLSRAMGDIVISDVFFKHGIKPEHQRKLSPEQKEEIKNLVEDIKKQVETFMQGQKAQKAQQAQPAVEAPVQEQAEAAPTPQRRLRLKRQDEAATTAPIAEAAAAEEKTTDPVADNVSHDNTDSSET